MFERFTHQARDSVIRAQDEARTLGHRWIGAEHLLLAAVQQSGAPGVAGLARLGVTPESVRETVTNLLPPPEGFSPAEADALQTLGIDLGEVKRRVEDSFGPGALDPPLPRRRSWLPWRRRCEPRAGHIPFTPRAKQVLEVALREAIARKDRHIGVEHVLLALVRVQGGVAREVLDTLGAPPEAVRRAVLSELDQAA